MFNKVRQGSFTKKMKPSTMLLCKKGLVVLLIKGALVILGLIGFLLFKFLAFFITKFGASVVTNFYHNTIDLHFLDLSVFANLVPCRSLPWFLQVLDLRDRVPILHVRILLMTNTFSTFRAYTRSLHTMLQDCRAFLV